jgi:hypothetical protein
MEQETGLSHRCRLTMLAWTQHSCHQPPFASLDTLALALEQLRAVGTQLPLESTKR